MHEVRLATEIISIVQKEMLSRGLNSITEIGLRIGPLSGVDPDALAFSFEAATTGTDMEQTKLLIEMTPLRGVCQACSEEFGIENFLFVCPVCESTDVRVIEGEDLHITWVTSA
jgi:hydrogenase nickel incorporation protein HypA/HybF